MKPNEQPILEALHCWQHRNDKYKVWGVGIGAGLVIIACVIILL